MTRWARGADTNRKRPLEASTWRDLRTGAAQTGSRDSGPSKKYQKVKKRDSGFKYKANYQYTKGEWQTDKQDDDSDTDIVGMKRPEDAPKPKGLAAELEDLKNSVDLSSEDEKEIAEVIKKEDRREKRRVKRLTQRESEKICYHCREAGHDMGHCPQLKGTVNQGTGICFKCGSTEHTVKDCRLKLPAGEYPFAKCFICEERGHLSKQCPDNPRGLYPNGGCCKTCGSVEHYKKDCPELQQKQGIQNIRLDVMGAGPSSVDADFEDTEYKVVKKKGPKLVKF